MVRITNGCDIPNLSDIVEQTYDSLCGCYDYDDVVIIDDCDSDEEI